MAEFTPQEIEQFLQEFFDVVGARQYIGARYVPIFGRAGSDTVEWDDLAPYEPLTVVMHQGVSYVSRRYVPAGIPITDTAYWVETYRFNAQVEQYRQEVLGFQAQINARIPFPVDPHSRFGAQGQVLGTLTDGTTEWVDPVVVDADIAEPLISDWLDDHPEATTTVQDGSITPAKFEAGAPFKPNVPYTSNQSANLDDITTPGIYPFTYNSSAGSYNPSFPVENYGNLIVTYANGVTLQIYVTYDDALVFTRIKVSSGWRDWENSYEPGMYFTPPVTYTSNQSANLDEITTPGIYPFSYNSSAGSYNPSFPVETYGNLIVTTLDTIVYQVYVADTSGQVFTRHYGSSGWGSWHNYVDACLAQGLPFTPPVAYTSNQSANLDEITTPGIYQFTYRSGLSYHPSFPIQNYGNLIVTQANGVTFQLYFASADSQMFSRLKGSGGWRAWATADQDYNKRDLSILFVGNSLEQDAVSYLPYLLTTYYPDINFHIYLWYIGGATLADQYAAFTNDSPADQFSVAVNTKSWTNNNGNTTMHDVLTTYKFDIVCIEEYFTYKSTYDDTDIATWNDCRDYIVSNYSGGNALEFVSYMHAPKRDYPDTYMPRILSWSKKILADTIADDIMVPGLAIYYALSTSLNNLGDVGGLSSDGTHAQEGLGCLMQAFVVLLWLLDRYGKPHNVYGSPARMTTALYETLNVPGPNLGTGVITGTTAENLLAQELAIKAYKKGRQLLIESQE